MTTKKQTTKKSTAKRSAAKRGTAKKSTAKRGTSLKKKNGVSKKSPFKITDLQKAEVRSLEEAVKAMKGRVSDISVQILQLKSERVKSANDLRKVQEALLDHAKKIAEGYGINPDDPTKGRWHLNTEKGEFERVD